MKIVHFTEIKVRRWKLLPKVRMGFLFDLYAWVLLFESKGVNISEIGEMKPEDMVATMMYNGAVSWSRDKGRKVFSVD